MFFFDKKIKIEESGFFQNYTETHCHLLPGVDDGAHTMEDSISILERLAMQGVHEVWLTPHIMEDFPNTKASLLARFEELQQNISQNPKLRYLTLHLAAEYMLDAQFNQILDSGQLLLHRDNQLLVETSYFNAPYNFEQLLEKVQKNGYTPLLAHPERYVYMEMRDYEQLKAKNIRFQLNLPSLLGRYGETTQKKAKKMLDKGWYDTIGTDLHRASQLSYILDAKVSKKSLAEAKLLIDN